MVLELDGLTVEHRDIRRLRAIGQRLERDARLAVVVRGSAEQDTVPRVRSLLQIAGFLVACYLLGGGTFWTVDEPLNWVQKLGLANESGLANFCRVLFNLNEFSFVD